MPVNDCFFDNFLAAATPPPPVVTTSMWVADIVQVFRLSEASV